MKLKHRRVLAAVVALAGVVAWLVTNPASYEQVFVRAENEGENYAVVASETGEGSAAMTNDDADSDSVTDRIGGDSVAEQTNAKLAVEVLEMLEVKGRAPKTGYSREEFYKNWPTIDGCSLRQRIIRREFGESAVITDGCNVVAGEYDEPYTGQHLKFAVREEISKGIQIDHVVALSDAWQKGAQYMSAETRYAMATDPLNLLAVDAVANGKKSDGDAATWLPANKQFRCQYVARQVSVKYKYALWVTQAEKEAISRVLANCPKEPAVGI